MKEGYNLVVSFANEDNTSSEKVKGWIDNFCRYLKIFVGRLSSIDIAVTKIIDFTDPGDKSKVFFIPVLSPDYLKSEKCKKELNQYIGQNCPLYRVQRIPINGRDLPKELNSELAYNFYERAAEAENGYILYDANSLNKNYWLKMIDLAYDIVQSIAKLEHQKTARQGKVVYLAETTYDQEASRDILKRELQRYGHTVLPDHPLPEEPKLLETEINGYLEKSSIAIHIVGAHYGTTINGTELSMVEFQNKIAKHFAEERVKNQQSNFKRFLWTPPYLRPADEKQMLYLDQLKEEVDQSTNAEIIQVPLEILKSIVEKSLDQSVGKKLHYSTESKSPDTTVVYLIYDKDDEADIKEMKSRFEKEKYTVITPDFAGNQISLLDLHRSNLVNCDAVFIYSNRSNNFWLNSKINDVIKSPGFGRSRPFLVKAVCTPNGDVDSSLTGFADLMVLKTLDNGSVNDFLGKLK